MANSTAPGAKQYLFDQITAAVAPVLVAWNDPLGVGADDLVVVGAIRRTIRPGAIVGGGGTGWLHEEYRVEVYVGSSRGGDNPAAADTACAALVDAVIAVVRADPSLGGRVLRARPGNHDLNPRPSLDGSGQTVIGYITECTVPIECYAVI
jgi:hypothetical protein